MWKNFEGTTFEDVEAYNVILKLLKSTKVYLSRMENLSLKDNYKLLLFFQVK